MVDESATPPKHEAQKKASPPKKAGPGADHVPRNVIVLVAVLGVLVAAFVTYSLWVFWPASTNRSYQTVEYFGWRRTVSRDTLFFLIVAFGGALGGLIHTLRSVSWYVGNRDLRWSWLLFYVTMPIIGALAGTVFYVVLRAGLLSPSASGEAVSPYGFTAVAIISGLFSEQAMEKLKQIATDIFSERPKGEDHVDPEDAAATGDESQ